ncbi:Uncharacterised protein [Mycobacteroides abscessus subsp. bolletii]|nr:Uncharacterised protein [Mycobacteroides abscessus subsp. bolletii]SKG34817.1 Uncharacterised protein [Mycobacteroides abscessus subsp. bolletii]
MLRRASSTAAALAVLAAAIGVPVMSPQPASGTSPVLAIARADCPPDCGGNPGGGTPSGPPGGGTEFVPPSMPAMPPYEPGRGQPPLDQNNGISIYNSAAPQPSQAAQPGQVSAQNRDGSYNRAANGEQQPINYNNAPNNQQVNNDWQRLSDQLNQRGQEQQQQPGQQNQRADKDSSDNTDIDDSNDDDQRCMNTLLGVASQLNIAPTYLGMSTGDSDLDAKIADAVKVALAANRLDPKKCSVTPSSGDDTSTDGQTQIREAGCTQGNPDCDKKCPSNQYIPVKSNRKFPGVSDNIRQKGKQLDSWKRVNEMAQDWNNHAYNQALPREDRWSVEHIIPIRRLLDIDDFWKLTRDQQVLVANLPDNLTLLSGRENFSKGDQLFSEYKKDLLTVTDFECQQELRATDSVRRQIEQFVKDNANSGIPRQLTPAECRQVDGCEQLPSPTALPNPPVEVPKCVFGVTRDGIDCEVWNNFWKSAGVGVCTFVDYVPSGKALGMTLKAARIAVKEAEKELVERAGDATGETLGYLFCE